MSFFWIWKADNHWSNWECIKSNCQVWSRWFLFKSSTMLQFELNPTMNYPTHQDKHVWVANLQFMGFKVVVCLLFQNFILFALSNIWSLSFCPKKETTIFTLNFTTLLVNSADDKLIVFSFFPENRIWHYMKIVSKGDNFHVMSDPVFCDYEEKYFNMSSAENWLFSHFSLFSGIKKKNISVCCLLKILPVMLSIDIVAPLLLTIFVLKLEHVHFTACWCVCKLLDEWQAVQTLIRCHMLCSTPFTHFFCPNTYDKYSILLIFPSHYGFFCISLFPGWTKIGFRDNWQYLGKIIPVFKMEKLPYLS